MYTKYIKCAFNRLTYTQQSVLTHIYKIYLYVLKHRNSKKIFSLDNYLKFYFKYSEETGFEPVIQKICILI